MRTGKLAARVTAGAISLLALLAAACSAPAPEATTIATQAPEPAASSSETPEASPTPPAPRLPMSSPVASGAPALATPIACGAEIGASAARKLVQQCIAVSPATHPPCNAANSCALIRSEIARSCALLDDKAAATPECGKDPISASAAADVIARYYAAINAHDFATAWSLWGPDGGSSEQTLDEFTKGYSQTRRTHVDIGRVKDVEGAAGSLYATIPVTVDAELESGRQQHFTGSYVVRRINRGMGPSQGWHIESATLRPSKGG